MKGRHHLVCMLTSCSYQLEEDEKKKRASEQVFPVFAEAQIRTKELLDKQLTTQPPETLQINKNRKQEKKKKDSGQMNLAPFSSYQASPAELSGLDKLAIGG